MIDIPGGPSIPDSELDFAASRAGGPGGQHVNKTASRIELRFDVANSPTLTDAQKTRIRERLGKRVSLDGVLRVVAASSRSQRDNRDEAVARFASLLARALREQVPRIDTRVPKSAKHRRLEGKKRRAAVKRSRTSRPADED